ncbi:hypothetical protein KCTC52924_01403 [Arenibacter antarcticus]|uniref:hypothetical protein n=1 Tax=Arenibacter antarcticus TaxID=2040469 RepID=UPI00351E456E
MTYLFFIASFNALFFIALLLQKRPKQLHDRILIIWLLYLGFATAAYSLTIDIIPVDPFLSIGIIASFLLHGPFLYLYVGALTLNKKYFKSKDLWHFLPYLAFMFYLLIAFQFPGYSEGISVDHVSEKIAEPPLIFILFLMITAVSGPVYFLLAFKRFRESKESTLDFSSKEVNMEWLEKTNPNFWSSLDGIDCYSGDSSCFSTIYHRFLYKWTISVSFGLYYLNWVFRIETKTSIY